MDYFVVSFIISQKVKKNCQQVPEANAPSIQFNGFHTLSPLARFDQSQQGN